MYRVSYPADWSRPLQSYRSGGGAAFNSPLPWTDGVTKPRDRLLLQYVSRRHLLVWRWCGSLGSKLLLKRLSNLNTSTLRKFFNYSQVGLSHSLVLLLKLAVRLCFTISDLSRLVLPVFVHFALYFTGRFPTVTVEKFAESECF